MSKKQTWQEKVTRLLEVRKIIALCVTLLFMMLAFTEKIDAELVEYVVVTVIAFYFAKSTALDKPENTKGE